MYFSNVDFSTLDKVLMLLLPRLSTIVCASKKKKKIEKEKISIIALRQSACINLDLILTILHTGIDKFVNVGFLT